MQFYKIIHAGGIEFDTVQTSAKARAKETGGSWEAIEVETNKPGLLTFFNDLSREAAGGAPAIVAAVDDNEPIAAPAPAHVHDKGETCKKCKFDAKAQQRWLDITVKSLNVQAMKQWIEERDGWELASVVESLMIRLGDITQTITGKKKEAA